ncbi:hypothetical protein ES677_04300 [Bizionia gelidisalsuginis]|uniref:Uncharacterized protein n=2 Tax=Bizionia TaxID=283785 RepID=A0A8H2LDZ5_9FLAO|nr:MULTISPECIES: hypothetical protein [Bizionia]TYB74120.1 hypothetical protein ES676_08020 [Bizionia saleffrena]TYC15568.1 hypothetical protein ES677_04300 [Bizionia gelidisalsuginis]
MKKKLESELISIAHRILKLKGKEDIDRLHKEVAELYEKLTVLKFAQHNFEDTLPTIGNDSSFFDMLDVAFNNKVSDNIEVENRTYINLDENEDDGIMEPVMEKIKDMVAQMPEESQEVDDLVDSVNKQMKQHETDFDDITADFNTMPIFDKVTGTSLSDEKKSLNDKLKDKAFSIGLNDKLAFIKHLFEGESDDYLRVISQLNTVGSYSEASAFIIDVVKPDYNHWTGKEEYETRFMEIVEAKFN